MVAAVGVSRVAEIESCNKYLEASEVVRFVLNKAPFTPATYGYYR
jgi:hypothetical protein